MPNVGVNTTSDGTVYSPPAPSSMAVFFVPTSQDVIRPDAVNEAMEDISPAPHSESPQAPGVPGNQGNVQGTTESPSLLQEAPNEATRLMRIAEEDPIAESNDPSNDVDMVQE